MIVHFRAVASAPAAGAGTVQRLRFLSSSSSSVLVVGKRMMNQNCSRAVKNFILQHGRRHVFPPPPSSSLSVLSSNPIIISCNNNNNDHSHYNSNKSSSLRFFSTSPPTDDDNKKESKQEGSVDGEEDQSIPGRIWSTVVTPQNQFYALVAGGTVGAYIISRVVLSFTSFFTHLTPTTIAKWSFYTGFGTASVLGGLIAMTADNLYIRADPVYKYCSNWVVGDTTVQQVLGDGLEPGNLRSYRLDSGKFHFDYHNKTPVWKPPRIQMIFDVTASGPPYRTGLVTCEAIKQAGFPLGKLQTTLLKVDYETGNEHEGGSTEGDETLWLVGSEQDLTRISSRSGISLDKLAGYCHINRAAKKL